MEHISDDYANAIKLEYGQQLNLWRYISFYWKEEPANDILSVILTRPAGIESMWLVVSKVTLLIHPAVSNNHTFFLQHFQSL